MDQGSGLDATAKLSRTEGSLSVTQKDPPLLPEPSNDPKGKPNILHTLVLAPILLYSKRSPTSDPLNWPLALKIAILLQVSVLSALGGINTAIINPAYVPLAEEFGITTVQAGYQTTVCIALSGIAPWLWIPLANKYGRRPVLIGTTSLGFASALGSAYARTFGQLVAARVFNGLFPAAFALGASVVVDLFFFHQRGRSMGVFTVCCLIFSLCSL